MKEFYLDIPETIIEADDCCHIFVFNPKPVPIVLFNNIKIGTIRCTSVDETEENLLVVSNTDNCSHSKMSNKKFIVESENYNESFRIYWKIIVTSLVTQSNN